MYQHGIKNTLKAGTVVFGLSALFLLIAPGLFLDLLGIDETDEMIWAMRMIAITLVALAGNMWQNSKLNTAASLGFVGRVMFIAAAALGFLTVFIPNELTPFAILYAIIGFGFSVKSRAKASITVSTGSKETFGQVFQPGICPSSEQQQTPTVSNAQAATLVGMKKDTAASCAAKLNWVYRIGQEDDQIFALTKDYRLDRVTVIIKNGLITNSLVG